jgi:hypothetical protein
MGGGEGKRVVQLCRRRLTTALFLAVAYFRGTLPLLDLVADFCLVPDLLVFRALIYRRRQYFRILSARFLPKMSIDRYPYYYDVCGGLHIPAAKQLYLMYQKKVESMANESRCKRRLHEFERDEIGKAIADEPIMAELILHLLSTWSSISQLKPSELFLKFNTLELARNALVLCGIDTLMPFKTTSIYVQVYSCFKWTCQRSEHWWKIRGGPSSCAECLRFVKENYNEFAQKLHILYTLSDQACTTFHNLAPPLALAHHATDL